ncbi:MAG: response regulator [Phycisphaerae bacterium]|jgi:DNA-binding NarL/FixJ family response regulator
MKSLVKANLLTVGLNGRAKILAELPVRMVSVGSAAEATRLIRNERFDGVLSTWDLDDMAAGLFLKRLRMVKPDIATIVLVSSDDPSQEILARSIGVCAVLTSDCSDGLLTGAVSSVLGIAIPVEVSAVKKQRRTPRVVQAIK